MARDEPQKAHEGYWRRAYSERRFGVLLVILVALLAGPPVLLGFGLSAAWFDGLMALLLVAAILSLCFERHQRLFALLLGIPTVLLSVGGHALPGEASKRFKDMERLRDKLAHGKDLVAGSGWDAVLTVAGDLEAFLRTCDEKREEFVKTFGKGRE